MTKLYGQHESTLPPTCYYTPLACCFAPMLYYRRMCFSIYCSVPLACCFAHILYYRRVRFSICCSVPLIHVCCFAFLVCLACMLFHIPNCHRVSTYPILVCLSLDKGVFIHYCTGTVGGNKILPLVRGGEHPIFYIISFISHFIPNKSY